MSLTSQKTGPQILIQRCLSDPYTELPQQHTVTVATADSVSQTPTEPVHAAADGVSQVPTPEGAYCTSLCLLLFEPGGGRYVYRRLREGRTAQTGSASAGRPEGAGPTQLVGATGRHLGASPPP